VYSLGVAGVSLFAIVYNVPRYFESTIVWNATENTGYFIRTSLGSSTLYTRPQMNVKNHSRRYTDDSVTNSGILCTNLKVYSTLKLNIASTLWTLCMITASSNLYTRLYMDVMYYVVSFILPLLLLGLFNAKLIIAYRQFRTKRRILRPTQLNARYDACSSTLIG